MTVLICGLPRSGNQWLMRQIKIAVEHVEAERRVVIWHGDEPASRGPRYEEYCASPGKFPLQVVIPVRNARCRAISCANHSIPMPRYDETDCRREIFKFVVKTGAPVKLLSYEALVADPVGVGDDLTDWLGLPRVWWTVLDGNTRYHPYEAQSYAENRKGRAPT